MHSLEYKQAFSKLKLIDESHLLKEWGHLTKENQKALLNEISSIDLDVLKAQKGLLHNEPKPKSNFTPYTNYFLAGNKEDVKLGKALIKEGKVGCLIIAGGQGTRLQFNGPKGMYPITPVNKKSLFELFAEKTLAAGKQAGKDLPLAIMTSPQNHKETTSFFKKNLNFGLKESQISFFMQGELPFLNQEGHLMLETPQKIAMGPDGNGSALYHFYTKGDGKKWEAQGVEYINFIVVDNPLADPFDAELIGHHARHQNEITIKCTARNDPSEKVGVLGMSSQHATVIEYSEIPEKEKFAKTLDGGLLYGCANLSLFSISLKFIKDNLEKMKNKMPLHKAFKAAKYLSIDGKTIQSEMPIAWKFEKFIFDVLEMSHQTSALLYPRNRCFAPLKNFSGVDSPETVKKALIERDLAAFEAVTGKKFLGDASKLELPQNFYYPTKFFEEEWKGKSRL